MFDLPALPYEMTALEPYISAKTMEFHYGKHHKAYVDNLNKLVKGTEFENMPLERVVKETYNKPEFAPIFNNAAQAWNHNFFWHSMKKNGGGNRRANCWQKSSAISGLMKNSAKSLKMPQHRNSAAAGPGWRKIRTAS